jgi:UDP-glucose 4-epimerase
MSARRWVIGITGGAGYIGSSLAKRLAGSFDLRLLDIKAPKKDIVKGAEFQACDIRNPNELKNTLKDVDLVIHTAIIQIPAINEQKKLGYEVNFLGTQNICKVVDEEPRVKGMILAGSWHTIGERGLKGVIDEEFGFRPDKVEDRARLYALAKMAQESTVRFHDEMSDKVFGIIRMGTVLGLDMPEKTAANIFIENGLKRKPLTPYRHSMFRPMLYVDIGDACRAYEIFARKILDGEVEKKGNSLAHVVNVYSPEPVTILDLAEIVRDSIIKCSEGEIEPKIEITDIGQPIMFSEKDKNMVQVDVTKALKFLGLGRLKTTRESIEEIVKAKMSNV